MGGREWLGGWRVVVAGRVVGERSWGRKKCGGREGSWRRGKRVVQREGSGGGGGGGGEKSGNELTRNSSGNT